MISRPQPSRNVDRSAPVAETHDHCADIPSKPSGTHQCPIRHTAAQEVEGLYRFAVARLGGKAHLAADVVQQALSIALAHASPPDAPDAQRAWLRGVVKNVIRREFRSDRRRRAALDRASPHQSTPGETDSAATDSTRARMINQLFLAVSDLDTVDQNLFYDFYRAGRSHADIAADLGVSVKAVEARLYRLRARLRDAVPFARNLT